MQNPARQQTIRALCRASMAAGIALTALLAASAARANSTSYTGTIGTTPISGTGTTIVPALVLPANVTFTDVLSMNTGTTAVTTTDDWSFTIPASVFGGTVTGDQINLTNFTVSGVVDSFALYAGAPGSGTLLASGNATGSFSQYLLGTITAAGSYYIEVQATLNPGSTGSYSGTLVAAATPVPEPGTWAMMAAALSVLAAGVLRRRN
jgi:hypothetical protein